MKKKNTIILVAALAVLILGSTVLYKALSANYNQQEEERVSNQTPEGTTDFGFLYDDTNVTESTSSAEAEAADHENELNQDTDTFNLSQEEAAQNSTVTTVPTTAPSVTEEVTKAPQATQTPAITETPVTQAPSVTQAPTATQVPQAPQATQVPQATQAPVPTKVPTKAPTQAPTAAPTKAPTNTNTAANFTVQDYNGNSYSLSNFFGKPIVVNFWASWCNPCKSEMPAFNTVYKEYKNDVVFLMVDMVSSKETKQNGYNYVTGQGFSFPVYYDVNQSAAYAYSVNSIPSTYFIDANGNIAKSHKGALTESSLRSEIKSLLNR